MHGNAYNEFKKGENEKQGAFGSLDDRKNSYS